MSFTNKSLMLLTSFAIISSATGAFAQQYVTQQQRAYIVESTPWQWQKSNCQSCGINFKLTKDDLENKRVVEFLQTIVREKSTIVKLYKSDPQEYNLLAHMAFGILGNESEFFKGSRYKVKRNSQMAITATKEIKAFFKGQDDVVPNSKGPTQIKKVPEKIAKHYGINEKDLWKPKNAAVATMGFLIEALKELKQRAKNNDLTHINQDTYVDYLPYIYFGGTKKLINRTATPDTNIYVKNMKKYMKRVQILETRVVQSPMMNRP